MKILINIPKVLHDFSVKFYISSLDLGYVNDDLCYKNVFNSLNGSKQQGYQLNEVRH